ncbi:3-hydroxyacyl-CoA dehydrogenase [Corynebacterium liangguodongii]|uniref:3-hydroxyacyl-CoA dehydrogenase n=1 Tax=Corynebacterium liangguodongii TaxID=2079535 RepID=A0A2S0WGK4_9CORY|nr:3-hydroxyacyl-CoA dehydrogenase [Corynebacterium liangguodongii]AWB84907.1 3-hydroxyacyl-CoA dehydrogenase [Corynebacterium liangguodongii]PWB99385.1 3-hydroxyacyl-CoA dehydrogenase [Corynebacterium liangguodongii]
MEINKVAVLGAGVLGSQIALVTAIRGFEVVSWDISEEAVEAASQRYDKFGHRIAAEVDDIDERAVAEGRSRLSLTTDLAAAVRDADLVIEAVPENLAIKREVWAKVGAAAPARAIFATNTSTLLPSDFAEATGRAEQFLALHFANLIWKNNTAEVMPHKGTDPAYVDILGEFAERIGMVPIKLKKEQPGYVLNTLLVPFLEAGMYLVGSDIAEPADVDLDWRNSTGSPMGPFETIDMIGLRTVKAVRETRPNDAEWYKNFGALVDSMIEKGHVGQEAGQGFFTYDDDGNIVG